MAATRLWNNEEEEKGNKISAITASRRICCRGFLEKRLQEAHQKSINSPDNFDNFSVVEIDVFSTQEFQRISTSLPILKEDFKPNDT